ncbi:hypothetical protein EV682_11498 [Iodobacter fluviatilis]|uniref:Uncharacterized protein n=1 Tax=Iodobacter fluviatilis TaxID=537 RepID=A0A377Q4V4_9NEIS|nr:hypothetical protein EV682_11498 [Iodobacter fluviatilis]STQ89795.1 Uncharacterised protein [Iodobacter fluviatilis]
MSAGLFHTATLLATAAMPLLNRHFSFTLIQRTSFANLSNCALITKPT